MIDRLPEPYRGGQGRTDREVERDGNIGLYVIILLAIVGAGVIGVKALEVIRAALAGIGQ